MIWESLLIAFCLALGFGAAFIMARKIKNAPPVQVQANDVDLESLIAKVAAAIGTQMSETIKEALKDLPKGSVVHYREGKEESEIQIDERVIPIKVSTDAIETNLEEMAKTETKEDKNLDSAKSKLAAMLKKKKEK